MTIDPTGQTQKSTISVAQSRKAAGQSRPEAKEQTRKTKTLEEGRPARAELIRETIAPKTKTANQTDSIFASKTPPAPSDSSAPRGSLVNMLA